MLSRLSMQASSRLSHISRQLSTTQIRSMAYANTKFKLNTGAEIPAIGFGTWQDKDAQEDAVYEALKAGYRHIDTARVYVALNEESYGYPVSDPHPATAQNQQLHEASRRAAFLEKISLSSPSCGTTTTTPKMWRRRAICR